MGLHEFESFLGQLGKLTRRQREKLVGVLGQMSMQCQAIDLSVRVAGRRICTVMVTRTDCSDIDASAAAPPSTR
ncbi:MAG: hypothetical protein JWP34_4447 [Massilia sp.]|jgi:hypothetical protein|nr:hypothetical protein [Massilia sp.]